MLFWPNLTKQVHVKSKNGSVFILNFRSYKTFFFSLAAHHHNFFSWLSIFFCGRPDPRDGKEKVTPNLV